MSIETPRTTNGNPSDFYSWPFSVLTKKVMPFNVRLDVIISISFVLISGIILILYISDELNDKSFWIGKSLWMIWGLAPPLYFICEWTSFRGEIDDPQYKSMKYSHELCSKFWLAGVTVITVILASKIGVISKCIERGISPG